MWRSLLIATTCLLGLATAATFFTNPVPEDPAHPAQCRDDVTGVWHKEHEPWQRKGECLQHSCSVSVGYLDSEGKMRFLEQIFPNVFTRFKDDPQKEPFSPTARNITTTFVARGVQAEYLHVEGESPAKPQAFMSEQTVTCFYHINLPSNCRETKEDVTLPYPTCCPKLSCVGEPQGLVEALG